MGKEDKSSLLDCIRIVRDPHGGSKAALRYGEESS